MYKNGEPIDAEALAKAVRELAAENPDFKYVPNPKTAGPACYYTKPDGSPDCIIGQAMARIGMPLPTQLRTGENECELLNNSVNSYAWDAALVGDSRTDDPLRFVQNLVRDSRTRSFLRSVQSWQDCGHEWSVAVERADQEVARIYGD